MAEEEDDVGFDAGEDDNNEEIDNPLAVSKSYYDTQPLGAIEDNIEAVDEIQLFINTAINVLTTSRYKNRINDICKQIYCFFAMIAYNANLGVGEMKAADHALKMHITYSDLVTNLALKEDWIEVFFSKWPKSELPIQYLDWADNKFRSGPKAIGKKTKEEALDAWINKEAKKYASSSSEVKLKVYFGAQLIDTAVKAAGVIKAHHNRYDILR